MPDISKMSDRELFDYLEARKDRLAKKHPELFVPEYFKYFANVNDLARDIALERLKNESNH